MPDVWWVLLYRWRWIIPPAMLAAVVVAVALTLRPAVYIASVDVLILVPAPERNQSLLHLVRNASVERAVREVLAANAPASLQLPTQFHTMVRATLVPRSSTIVIRVWGATPALAEQVAVAWGRAYERQMNHLMGFLGTGPSDEGRIVMLVSEDVLAQREQVPYVPWVPVAAGMGAAGAAALIVARESLVAARNGTILLRRGPTNGTVPETEVGSGNGVPVLQQRWARHDLRLPH